MPNGESFDRYLGHSAILLQPKSTCNYTFEQQTFPTQTPINLILPSIFVQWCASKDVLWFFVRISTGPSFTLTGGITPDSHYYIFNNIFNCVSRELVRKGWKHCLALRLCWALIPRWFWTWSSPARLFPFSHKTSGDPFINLTLIFFCQVGQLRTCFNLQWWWAAGQSSSQTQQLLTW